MGGDRPHTGETANTVLPNSHNAGSATQGMLHCKNLHRAERQLMGKLGDDAVRLFMAVQRSRERPLPRRAKGCNGGRTRPLNGKRCNFLGHCLSGPIPIRTNNPQNCGTRAVLRNETRARKSPKPACRLAPRPGLEPGTCGLTVRRPRHRINPSNQVFMLFSIGSDFWHLMGVTAL